MQLHYAQGQSTPSVITYADPNIFSCMMTIVELSTAHLTLMSPVSYVLITCFRFVSLWCRALILEDLAPCRFASRAAILQTCEVLNNPVLVLNVCLYGAGYLMCVLMVQGSINV